MTARMLLTLALVLPSLSNAQGPSCADYLGGLGSKVASWSLRGRAAFFDADLFASQKTEIQSRLLAGANRELLLSGLNTVEGKLAFIEATAQFSNTRSFADVLATASSRDKILIRKALRKFDFTKPMEITQARDVLETLYLIANSRGTGLDWLMKIKSSYSIRHAIDRRIELELASHGFVTALEDLGLIRPDAVITRINNWSLRSANIFRGISALAINIPAMLIVGFPLYTPNFNVLSGLALKTDLLQDVRAQGFDAAYAGLPIQLKLAAGFDLAWRMGQKAYVGCMSTLTVFLLISNGPSILNTLDLAFVTDQQLQAAQQQSFEPQRVRDQRMQSWREAFYEFEGRWPDIEHNVQDRAEWEATLKSLNQTSDEDLKATFGNHSS